MYDRLANVKNLLPHRIDYLDELFGVTAGTQPVHKVNLYGPGLHGSNSATRREIIMRKARLTLKPNGSHPYGGRQCMKLWLIARLGP